MTLLIVSAETAVADATLVLCVIFKIVLYGEIPSLFVDKRLVGSKEVFEIAVLPCILRAILAGSAKPELSSSEEPNPN